METALNYFNGDELAASVWSKKYRIKDEQTPKDSQKRYVNEFANVEYKRLMNFKDSEDLNERLEKLSFYGKKRYSNLLNYDIEKLREYIDNLLGFDKIILGGSMLASIGNHENYSSLSNCLVLGRPYDSYAGISQKTEELSEICKRRCGAGIDISSIRPDGAKINNQASISSGPVLFANRYSNITLEIAQRGRRGALMISLHINHPDSLAFAEEKQDLTKLTGCNTSLIISDEFMEAVENDTYFIQRFPVDIKLDKNKYQSLFENIEYNVLTTIETNNTETNNTETIYIKKIKAREVWNKIIDYAHKTAEPGIIFENNWYQWGTDGFYEEYKPITTNPCFAGETKVLTSKGYYPIKNLVNKKVSIWNGETWSEVIPKITNEKQEMIKIIFSDGSIVRCTKYHKWPTLHTIDGKHKLRTVLFEAQDLRVGDKLEKFELPESIDGTIIETRKNLYTIGFYTGFTYGVSKIIKEFESIPEQASMKNILKKTGNKIFMKYLEIDRVKMYANHVTCDEYIDNSVIENNVGIRPNLTSYMNFYTKQCKLDILAGMFDANGIIVKTEATSKNGNNNIYESIHFDSNDFEILDEIRLMLTTLGIKSKIINFKRKICRLVIDTYNTNKLRKLGLITNRLKFESNINNIIQTSSANLTIKKINYDGVDDVVYCFNEPFKHRTIVNGVISSQCSEIPMQAYDSCRLMSVNLYELIDNPFTDKSKLNEEKAYQLFYEQLTLLDASIDLETEYIQRIIDKIKNIDKDPEELKQRSINLWTKIMESGINGRRTGAGFTGLGDMLAALDYDYKYTEQTKNFLIRLFSIKLKAEIDATTDMSILYGKFKGCVTLKEFTNHISPYNDYLTGNNKFMEHLVKIYPEGANKMYFYGRRNVSWSTAAPTGSLSILSQTTSGIEPLFLPYYVRRKKVMDETERVDYIDPADGQKFTTFPVFHPKFKWWIENIYYGKYKKTPTDIDTINQIFKDSPWFCNCANDISWQDRVRIQSLVQKFTTHAISSTINLPRDIPVSVVRSIYWTSWKLGLKGNTIYRDGSRGGVLINNDSNNNNDTFDEVRAPKRPIRLPAKYHTIHCRSKIYSVIIGFFNNKPYEIFVASGLANLPDIIDDNEHIDGELIKEAKDWYNFECDNFILKEISDIEGEEKMLSLMISMALRHRTPLKFIIKTIEKTQPIIGTFTYKLIKILSKYVPDGESNGSKCPECGNDLTFESGCCVCKHCGWSRC